MRTEEREGWGREMGDADVSAKLTSSRFTELALRKPH